MSLIDEITVECIIPLQQMQLEKLVFQLAIKCEKVAERFFSNGNNQKVFYSTRIFSNTNLLSKERICTIFPQWNSQ